MEPPQKILAIDIGSGTQDILLYEEGTPMENCVQMILPSPTQIVARKISKATASRKNIFLFGNTMGGGPCSYAVEKHIQAGLKVYATELAALTFHDNLEEVRRRGVKIVKARPKGTEAIRLGDVSLRSLRQTLNPFQVEFPAAYALAVQDHGFNPQGSNRRLRFHYWETFLSSGGNLRDLIYFNPPPYMTRMVALQRDIPAAAVMDTCAAAIWGILCDPRVREKQEEGFIAVNLGNQHTLGALIQDQRIWGIFEHHTGRITPAKLHTLLDRFARRLLTNDEIFQDGGHGCVLESSFSKGKGFRFVAITGPRRALAESLRYYMAAPYGNMMLTGCFGLIAALKANLATENTERNATIKAKRRPQEKIFKD